MSAVFGWEMPRRALSRSALPSRLVGNRLHALRNQGRAKTVTRGDSMVTTAKIGIVKTQMIAARLSILWLLISVPLFAQTISRKQASTDANQLVRAVIV